MAARVIGATLAICLLSNTGWAQPGLRSASLPDRTPENSIPAPRPDGFRAGPDTFAPPDLRRGRQRQPRLPVVGGFGGVFVPWPYGPPAEPVAQEEPTGYLHLQVQPAAAQVYINGVYVGTADDFRRIIPGRSIEAGVHRLELRAPGYVTVTEEIRIFPSETLTYRRELQPAAPPPRAAAVAAAAPRTFYVIPGCYAGDKPPRPGRLPAKCDVSRVRAIPPVVSAAARTR